MSGTGPRAKLRAVITLAVVFLVGAVAGVGVAPLLPLPRPPIDPGLPPSFMQLGLDRAQKQRAHEIVLRHRPEIDHILRDAMPQLRAIRERIDGELRQVLTPEQREKLDHLEAQHRDRPPFPPPPGP